MSSSSSLPPPPSSPSPSSASSSSSVSLSTFLIKLAEGPKPFIQRNSAYELSMQEITQAAHCTHCGDRDMDIFVFCSEFIIEIAATIFVSKQFSSSSFGFSHQRSAKRHPIHHHCKQTRISLVQSHLHIEPLSHCIYRTPHHCS